MKVTLGKVGLSKTWQKEFPETTKCCHCKGEARIGFVAHEAIDKDDKAVVPRDYAQFVADLHYNEGMGGFWLHDACAVAVYFCKKCCEATALWNQA